MLSIVCTVSSYAPPVAPAPPATLPSELLRRRPDIAAAEYRIAAADAKMRVARADFMPSIDLGASAGLALSDLLADPISVWSLGGSILAPIFQGGRLQAQLDGATAQRDQAAWAYRSTVLGAFREVEDRMAILANLGEQQTALEAQQSAVADALRHARNRYRAGYTPYIEQVDAQRALHGDPRRVQPERRARGAGDGHRDSHGRRPPVRERGVD